MKPRIYIETTLFNYYYDDERGFAHESTRVLINEIADCKYQAFTSTYVTDELEAATPEKRDKMLSLIKQYDIKVLAPSEEATRIANLYIQENIIPIKFRTDSLHIAVATINNLDMIISLNFKHIVKMKTKKLTADINIKNGYKAIEIYSPMEVIDYENE